MHLPIHLSKKIHWQISHFALAPFVIFPHQLGITNGLVVLDHFPFPIGFSISRFAYSVVITSGAKTLDLGFGETPGFGECFEFGPTFFRECFFPCFFRFFLVVQPHDFRRGKKPPYLL